MAKTDVVDEFADLLPQTTVQSVQNKKAVDQWDGPIPDSAKQWAELGISAYETKAAERRVKLPVSNVETAKRLNSAIKAAVNAQDGTLTIYSTYHKSDDEDGALTHFSFVVGKPRGRGNKESE